MNDSVAYSEWRNVIDAGNTKQMYVCPTCGSTAAYLERRYVTGRDGERFEQYRISCTLCKTSGRVYQNRNVAIQSWSGGEHISKEQQKLNEKMKATTGKAYYDPYTDKRILQAFREHYRLNERGEK